MIEVCMAVYQRHDRIPALIEQFKNQTNQNFKLNIWNNSKESLLIPEDFKDRVFIYNSLENIGSQARFRLVPMTTGNPIIFLDDDEEITIDFIDYHYRQYMSYGKNCILGWFSKTWDSEEYWLARCKRPYGEEVDYIGTGGMIIDREIFDKDKDLQNIPLEYCKAEDLYLSAIARQRYGMKLFSIEQRCRIIVDGLDQYGSLKPYKQKAFDKLRREGWKLLKDKT